MEDKATFVFFTVDEKAPSFFNKFYIFSRSGSVVKNDARILECFFNSVAENKLLNRSILTQILSHTSAKTQFHSGNSRSSIKNIVKPK
ncbi:CIC_collapsed_G0048770.mRNA.1.CDS.1 [Saccharomyces cerevisiae]|nr:CIC_collapsed_G0048770.mRNA.1.CDS.1 [Saccharomyces cerevisiae]